METSAQVDKILPALIKAQQELPFIKAEAKNPFFGSKYAPLPHLLAVIKPILFNNNLAIIQGGAEPTVDMLAKATWVGEKTHKGVKTSTQENEAPVFGVTTMLIHGSGQWIRMVMFSEVSQHDPQGLGSLVTYLRRYSVCALMNIAPDADDDGNLASMQKASNGGSSGTTQGTQKAQNGKEPTVDDALAHCMEVATAAAGQAHAHDLVNALLDILPANKDAVQSYRAVYGAIVERGANWQKAMNQVIPADENGQGELPMDDSDDDVDF